MRPQALFLSVCLVLVHTALAQPPARLGPGPLAKNRPGLGRMVLRRMVKAEMTVAFAAHEVTVGQEGRSLEQWVKRDPQRGVRRESIQPKGVLLVDNRRRQFLIQTGAKRYFEGKSQLAEMQKRLTETLRAGEGSLVVALQGQDTIAGRVADVVLVQPAPGAMGPSRRFWVDRETGLRLRTEERAPDGRILSNSYFLSLELNPSFRAEEFTPPPVPAGFRLSRESQKRYNTIEAALKAGVALKQPTWLPQGFRLRRVTVTEGTRTPINIQWGNDLTALSLVQSRGALPPLLMKLLAGGESGFGKLPNGERAYAWKTGDGYAMLLGNLPDEQLKRIADSVK